MMQRFFATVTGLRCRALMWMGETRLAADELMRAAEAVQCDDEAMAARLLNEAVMPIAMSGDVDRCFDAAIRSEALVQGELASFHGRVMIAAAYLLHGAMDEARYRLGLAELLRPDIDPVSEQHALAIMAEVYWWLEDFEAAKQLITSIVELLRQRGASAALAFALTIRDDVAFRTGQWSSAYADAVEARQWAEEMQQLSMIGYSLRGHGPDRGGTRSARALRGTHRPVACGGPAHPAPTACSCTRPPRSGCRR